MKETYPSIQLRSKYGWLAGRDGVVISFYIHRDHDEVAPAVWRAIQDYARAIPAQALSWYVSYDGDMVPLDEAGWKTIQDEVLAPPGAGPRFAELLENPSEACGFQVEYYGRQIVASRFDKDPVTVVSFTLPTEYLLEHGAQHLRNLAFTLARDLPFSFGYASFSIIGPHGNWGVTDDLDALEALLDRYVGMDLHDVREESSSIGTRALGAHWLTFLGQPLLGKLGGVAALQEALSFPGTALVPMEGDRLLITLAPEPDPLDTQKAAIPPQYLALGRLLKPFLHQRPSRLDFDFFQIFLNRSRRRLCP